MPGVTRDTPHAFRGEIKKGKQTGDPNGSVPDPTQPLIATRIPAGGAGDAEQEILLGVKRSIELGWCEIQNAGSSFAEVALLKKLYGEGKIKLRIYEAIAGPGPGAERLLREGEMIGAFENHLAVRHIKVVIDGAPGAEGAELLEPYSDYDTAGFLTQKEE